MIVIHCLVKFGDNVMENKIEEIIYVTFVFVLNEFSILTRSTKIGCFRKSLLVASLFVGKVPQVAVFMTKLTSMELNFY